SRAAPGPRPPGPATGPRSAGRRPAASHKQPECVIPLFSALAGPAAAEKRLLRAGDRPHRASLARYGGPFANSAPTARPGARRRRVRGIDHMGYRVAIVGATGNVGQEMLNILEELEFPVEEMHAVASRRSLGVEVGWGDKTLTCQDIEGVDFSKMEIVLMSAGGDVSREWSEKIGKGGAMVIDNSSAFRKDPEVPLIVPEVNPDDVKLATKKNI